MDPRATQIITSADQEDICLIIEQLQQKKQHVNASFVLSKFIECGQVKNEPEFCQILFHDHLDVVIELIQWMLMPKTMIARKKIKTNVDSYPDQTREFIKDNWCFYEQLYVASRHKKFQFGSIFNFLRKEYFNKDTIYTALAYFADAMIPFAKYQFSGSFNLTKSLEGNTTTKNEQTLSIMKILPQSLIDELINYCHYQPIFMFLKTAILVSIEDPRDYQISKSAALKLKKAAMVPQIFSKFPVQSPAANDELARAMQYLQNVSNSLKDMTQNIEATNTSLSFRTGALINSVLDSQIIQYATTQLIKSRLCGPMVKQKDKLHSSVSLSPTPSDLTHSTDLMMNAILSTSVQIGQNMASLTTLPSLGSFPIITDYDEEELAEILLRILSSAVEVYIKIPRHLSVQEEQSPQNLVPPQEYKPIESASPKFRLKQRGMSFPQYTTMMNKYRQQMQLILNNMEVLTKFVYNETESGNSSWSRVIPFASGENVKAVSFMKLEYFKLLHNCLMMVQWKEPEIKPATLNSTQQPTKNIRRLKSLTIVPFELKIESLFSLQIIKKYLNQNRWNNIAHHMLQKICHLLIINSYDYIKKNIEKDKNNKFSDSFLSYLIENFTKRDFVFLNTVKFTTQGNLHSLYNISKDLAYTLNSTNQLVVFLNEFEPWKKFIMTDLKNYEDRVFPTATKPDQPDKNDGQTCNIKVDEVDSIKKLIENISITQKWPNRTKNKNKNMSKSGVFRLKNTNEQFIKSDASEHMLRSLKSKNSDMKIESFELNLDSILKKPSGTAINQRGSLDVTDSGSLQQIPAKKTLEQRKAETKSADTETTKFLQQQAKIEKSPSHQST